MSRDNWRTRAAAKRRASAPGHYTARGKPKSRIPTLELAERAAAKLPGCQPYACSTCRGWHVGRPSVIVYEDRDPALDVELGDRVVRAWRRENAWKRRDRRKCVTRRAMWATGLASVSK